jgi:hypothetical protein
MRVWRSVLGVGLALCIVGYVLFVGARDTGKNLYAFQAEAWLRGRNDITASLPDVAHFEERAFCIFPPFPALLLVPVVAVFGAEHSNTAIVGVVLAGVATWVLFGLLRHLALAPSMRRWVAGGFVLGTGYWYAVAQSGKVWFFAHVVAVTCVLLAIDAALRRGSGLAAGLWLGGAVLSRQMCVFASIFLVAALWQRAPDRSARRRSLGAFAVALTACLLLFGLFNWMRFGDPFDSGYGHLAHWGFAEERVKRYGLFHPVYVPFNALYLLVQGFHVEFASPRFLAVERMDRFGTALLVASPFVLLAPWARWDRSLLITAWVSIALAVAGSLLYFNNGFTQTNTQRFTLDYLPLLILLVARAAPRHPDVLRAAVGYAVMLNVVALVVIPLMGRITTWLAL